MAVMTSVPTSSVGPTARLGWLVSRANIPSFINMIVAVAAQVISAATPSRATLSAAAAVAVFNPWPAVISAAAVRRARRRAVENSRVVCARIVVTIRESGQTRLCESRGHMSKWERMLEPK
ncbi:unnamed protein product [Prorocentrum cordatum]|uniref:Uncharacterized protein n=1 Tax=Prorocentrum cordatum TaxID=2364126 RepID=A0ABN9TP02_9DINO|nr:unnamed protein product [Polarella glacialis]